MSIVIEEKTQHITMMLNSTITSVKNVIPIPHQVSEPSILPTPLNIQYGVLIGLTGDVKGNLVLTGNPKIFSAIGESLFGMPIEGDMLSSFSGELGNMIAGGLATSISTQGINTDISAPTILQGNTNLTGFGKAIRLTIQFELMGNLDICLLLD
ncbi:chemotaxis protein CheX [Oceanobacillus sp. Castelsardo]|uniref:chemotaxis protein CheX n=1 Tax=Oceanobacillus sp. Castelsardo TaxID=1851204 RepID=UPI0009EEBC71|nr:chemotaxis protein CheX [Oceanobacillus sp. Castelsardo]